MKIRAILIGCEGIGDEYLAGVHKDIDNMHEYLLSNDGGQWQNDEITIVKTSSKSEVLSAIKQAKDEENDFTLFFFAGHGSYNELSGRKFYINKTDYITQNNIKGISDKQINIFDTCASYETSSIEESLKYSTESYVYDSITNHRKQYLTSISNCPPQIINVYSCSENEASGESSKGGFFTQSLIAESKKSTKSLTIIEAFSLAEVKVKNRTHNEQNPDYVIKPRSGKKLPFKVVC